MVVDVVVAAVVAATSSSFGPGSFPHPTKATMIITAAIRYADFSLDLIIYFSYTGKI